MTPGIRLLAGCLIAAAAALIPFAGHAQQKHVLSYERAADSSEYTRQLRIDVGDVPGHQIRAYELEATHADDSVRFLDVPLRKEYVRGLSDYVDSNGRHFGYTVYVLENEDRIYARIDGTTQAATNGDGTRNITFSGVTTLTGGTGKFKGIRGALRYSGFYDPVANRSGDRTEGEYWFED